MSYIYDTANDIIEKGKTRNPFSICENEGIKVKFADYFDRLPGMVIYMFGKPIVIINSNLTEQQQREVCAHELGHILLHADAMSSGYLENYEIYEMQDKKEYQANVFAAHLLIDEDEMLDHFYEGYDVFATSKILEVNPILLNIKLTDMNHMGYNFPTSWGGTKLF